MRGSARDERVLKADDKVLSRPKKPPAEASPMCGYFFARSIG
jgi:hypothetical protein